MTSTSLRLATLVATLACLHAEAALYWYPPQELMDPQFGTEVWGSGTLDSRSQLPDTSVQFSITLGDAVDAGKTVIGDDWSVSPSAGLESDDGYLPGDPSDPHASAHDNVNIAAWDGIMLPVRYTSGSGPITMKLFMNTGMTGPSGYPSNDSRNNSGWTGVAQTLTVGETAYLSLDFANAQVWDAANNPEPHSGAGESWADGTWHTINQRDLREVTNFGFEVYGPANAAITLVLNTVPEPSAVVVFLLMALAAFQRRTRRPYPLTKKPSA